MKLNRAAFTLVEIMVVTVIIGALASIATVGVVNTRNNAAKYACVGNLREIESAKAIWAIMEEKAATDRPEWDDLVPTYLKKQPACPSNGYYIIGPVNIVPVCSKHVTLGHAITDVFPYAQPPNERDR